MTGPPRRMTRVAVIQPALALGEIQAQPRPRRGPRSRRPPRARRRGDRAARGDGQPERVREAAAVHPGARSTASPCICSRAWRASSTACSRAASWRSAAGTRTGPTCWRSPTDRCTCTTRTYRRRGSSTSTAAAMTPARSAAGTLGLHRGPDVGLGVGALPHQREGQERRSPDRHRGHVLALGAHRLAGTGGPAEPHRARPLARAGRGPAGTGGPPHGGARGTRLARRADHRRNAAHARGPVADGDDRRVADLRPRRLDPGPPHARAGRGPRRRRRRPRRGAGARGGDPRSLLDPRDVADDQSRLALDERDRRALLFPATPPPRLPVAGAAAGRPARRGPPGGPGTAPLASG